MSILSESQRIPKHCEGALILGIVLSSYFLSYMGQYWSQYDLETLQANIKTISVEQDKPRQINPDLIPQERSSAPAKQKVINKYYKMEKGPEAVPNIMEVND